MGARRPVNAGNYKLQVCVAQASAALHDTVNSFVKRLHGVLINTVDIAAVSTNAVSQPKLGDLVEGINQSNDAHIGVRLAGP
jgi:hypothetical protein